MQDYNSTDVDRVSAQLLIGWVYEAQGQFSDAISTYDRASKGSDGRERCYHSFSFFAIRCTNLNFYKLCRDFSLLIETTSLLETSDVQPQFSVSCTEIS